MKKNQAGFGVLELLLVLTIIGLIGAAGWLLYSREKSASSQQTTNSALQPETVTAKIKGDFAAQYKLLPWAADSQPKQGEMSINLTKDAPAYKTAGYDYYTDYNGGSTLNYIVGPVTAGNGVTPRETDIKIRTETANIYKSFGLTKTGTYGTADYGMQTDVYMGKGLICVVDSPSSPLGVTAASCGLIAAYRQAAAKVQPFTSLLPDLSQTTILSRLRITTSKVAGYQKAQLEVGDISYGSGGGSVALFYKKDAGPWVYFKSSQETIYCSAYNTNDLKNAFMGDVCTDDAAQSFLTVH